MKISMSSDYFLNFGKNTVEELDAAFKRMSELGFEAIDLSGCVGDFYSKPEEEKIERYKAVKAAADKWGIEIGQFHAPFPSFYKDEETNARLNKEICECIRACKILDCPYIVIHPAFFRYEERMDAETEWETNIKFYSSFIDVAKESGVKICLENMFTNFKGHIIGACCSDTYEAVAYIEELNGIAGENLFCFCFDSGHINLLGKNMYNTIVELGDVIETLHVHDNYGNDRDSHDVPYSGNTDWDSFIEGLKAIGYKGNMNFEIGAAAITKYPKDIQNSALKLLSETGRYFRKEIIG